jgi:two-component system, chemotaxis family, CheB/CheR fusion protein
MRKKPRRVRTRRNRPKAAFVALPTAPQPALSFGIVGVGASAGGFEAFSQLLEALPPNPNLAIIFIQHLAPHHSSSLASLLATHTPLGVLEATEGVRIMPNRVYVVPPNRQMELVDGHLHLGRRPEDRSQYNPIDFFFRSLARALGGHAIGVVLSGTASDGALGIREIKTMEGITFAQDPATAKYDGMPRAAIATQMVDIVASPAEIAAKVTLISTHPYLARSVEPHTGPTIEDEQLQRIFRLLLPACGVNFSHYKTPTIIRRLFRRMALLRMIEPESYIRYLERTPAEVVNLHNDLLIHVTRFFREPESFAFIADEVLPSLDLESGMPLRIWVAGCATGEEVYSLAMIVHEALDRRPDSARVQIFGTDVSESAVAFARQGLYAASIADDVSPERLRAFFVKTDGGYQVSKTLRDMCVFARQDLTRDPPFSHLDLICCRNVLIYMDSALQRRLLSMFHYALKPSAFLVLGRAESIGYHSDLFTLMNKKNKVYSKKVGAAIAPHMDVFRTPLRAEPAAPAPLAGPHETRLVLGDANRIIMQRYAPPSVLLDQHFNVVQFNGQTGHYLEPSPGEPSFDILKLAREGLSHGLRKALQAARKTRKPAREKGLHVRHGGASQAVDVEAIPVMRNGHLYYLVLFQTAERSGGNGRRPATREKKPTPRSRIGKLEEELSATREYLQSTIQEIEAANEELQSANEEILSSNEELQSTNEELDTAKEELQSTNEELNTVNDELHARNEELTRVNADLLNLLASVQIAIVIVARDLRIRRFTPMAEKRFNLIPNDIGRPFSQISSTLQCPELPNLITETIDTVSPVERTVQDTNGETYLLRIRPYKTPDNRIDGAVIALFDLDPAKK